MTAQTVGRPRRNKPYTRVNYNLDTSIRSLLTQMAERKGRNEGSQVERLILQGEAIDRLVNRQEPITISSIEKEITEIWESLSREETNGTE